MKFLIVITPQGFRDETLSTARLLFDKWDVGYEVSSYSNRDCTGSHGAIAKIQINTNRANPDDYDGIFIVDGKGIDAYKLYDFRPMLDLLMKFNDRKKKIIAVGNAVRVPARANIIKQKKISVPGEEESRRLVELFHGIPSNEPVELSDNVITIGNSAELDRPLQTVMKHFGII